MRMTTLRIIPVLLALFLAHAMGGEPKIAILGDSIPYSGQWPALVEAALRQAKSQLEASANHLMVLYSTEQDAGRQ